jgi:hypothetical protein
MAASIMSLTGCGNAAGGKWSGLSGIKVPWGDYEESVYNYTANVKNK